ncbi:hypothetical protein Scep_001599 [Stephania cephalantha]|uniref:Uncharacterized protein n=1 Tax=Stephania cephalantha TaxID=152367 RepID=A0AAP0L8C4_9MAGN
MSTFAIETTSFCGICRRSCCLPSLPLKSSPSSELFVAVVYSVPRSRTLDPEGSSLIVQQLSVIDLHYWELFHFKRSVREVAELYGSDKSLPVVEAHHHLSGLHSIALSALERNELGFSGTLWIVLERNKKTNTSERPPTLNELYLHLHTVNHDGVTFIDTRSERFYAKLQRRRQELTQATPDQPVDDEAMYYNVAGKCPRGCVYGFGSSGRKKRRFADPGAITSQMPEMVPHSEFDSVVKQLRQVVAFMQRQFGMTMEGAGLSQPQPPPPPPPPPPHERQQAQTYPVDPPLQQENVDREMQDWLTRDEQLGDT